MKLMKSVAPSVEEYLAELPDDRKEAIATVRELILSHLPDGYEEVLNWGMISYQVPIFNYPDTYNKQPLMYLALGNQKNYMTLHLPVLYGNEELRQKFNADYAASGKKLDMGKGCLRFKRLEDLPLDVIARTVGSVSMANYIAWVKRSIADRKSQRTK